MLERAEGECIDCRTIIPGVIYPFYSVLRLSGIYCQKRGVSKPARIQIWDDYSFLFFLILFFTMHHAKIISRQKAVNILRS